MLEGILKEIERGYKNVKQERFCTKTVYKNDFFRLKVYIVPQGKKEIVRIDVEELN